MSGLAVFQLKHPSLLAFDKQRKKEPQNLHSMFGITNIPYDSQMRAILDPLSLSSLRAPFRTVFRHFQWGENFEKMAYVDGHYLLSGDGTEITKENVYRLMRAGRARWKIEYADIQNMRSEERRLLFQHTTQEGTVGVQAGWTTAHIVVGWGESLGLAHFTLYWERPT